jgi:hypothetical protein
MQAIEVQHPNVWVKNIDPNVWKKIFGHLTIIDQLRFASTCRWLYTRLWPEVICKNMQGGLCSFIPPGKRYLHTMQNSCQCSNWRGHKRSMYKLLCEATKTYPSLVPFLCRDISQSVYRQFNMDDYMYTCAARDCRVEIMEALNSNNCGMIEKTLSPKEIYLVAVTAIVHGNRPVIQWLMQKNVLDFGLMRLKRLALRWMRRRRDNPLSFNESNIIIECIEEARAT